MKEKKYKRDGKLYRPGSLALAFWIVAPAIFTSVLSGKPGSDPSHWVSGLFTVEAAVDVEKQKSDIDKAFDKAQELLAAVKLQDIRGTLDLLDRKISKIKNDISPDEAAAYASRIDKVKKSATTAEDSLINRAYEILGAQGQDSALLYTANELRVHGVPEAKISAAEKKILKEGPAIKQVKDQEAITRTVKLLESGQKPDPSTDRFLLQSAQRIVKMRQDSAKALEDTKSKKDMDEQKRQEKARLDKEKKEKKDEDDRQAALKKEDEKKQRETDKVDKMRLAEEESRTKQFRDAQEKARKDSIETARKADAGKESARKDAAKRLEDARFSRTQQPPDEDSRPKSLGKQDKARRDSAETQQRKLDEAKLFMDRKAQADEDNHQKQSRQDKARRDSLEAKRKAQDELATHQEELRRMMEDELKEKQRQSQLQEAREEKMLQKQQAEQQEKARKDSIDAYRKDQEQQKQQEKDRRAQMARMAKDRSRDKQSGDAEGASGKQQSSSSEAERWGIGASSKDEQVEERKEKERLAKLLEEERQKKNLREIQEVQHLAKQEKARQDSMDAQRRLQDQQDNQRRIGEDRRMKAQQEKDRRLAEEQKKQDELDNQRHIAEERKTQAQQEKDRRLAEDQRKRDQQESQRRQTAERDRQDNQRQIDEPRKQREMSARSSDDDRQEKIPARLDRSRKLTVDAQIPTTTKPDMEQDEIQQLLENVRKEKDRLTRLEQQLQQQIVDKQGERARQDSAQDAAKRYRTSQVTRPAMADPETKRRILQSDEERRRQLLALQEKARLDYQKKLDEEKSKLEQNRRRWQQAQQARQESIRQDNASSGRKGGISVNIDKDAAKYDEGDAAALPKQTSAYFLPPRKEEPAPSQPPQRSYDKPEPAQSQPPQPQRGYDKPEPQQNEKAASDNDWKSKEKRRRAEKFVADIYKAMEKNQVKKARQIFDANRDYMSQYADLEVFNMVQQTIITAENAAAKAPSRTQASSERSSAYSSEADLPPQRTQTVQPPPVKERVVKPEPVVSRTETVVNAEVNWEGNELEYISRINGFVRDGNGKAAYKEFKKVEEQLKNYFTVEEFSHFKAMVENANSR